MTSPVMQLDRPSAPNSRFPALPTSSRLPPITLPHPPFAADASVSREPTVRRIALEARRIAHEVRALVDQQALDDGRTTSMPAIDGPLLTKPIEVPRPHPVHWVLIGALLEDVRQARESLEAGGELSAEGV